MHTNFYNHITKYFDLIENKKILILNDPYYSFSATKKNINIEKKIDKLINNKNIKLVNKAEEFLKLTEKFEIIINIFFSATFINQINFYNQVLKNSVLETQLINILPFSGFINYGYINFNPIFFEIINSNKNFKINEIAFLDKYGIRLQIKENFINKIFFQSTENRNQSFIDHLYNEINKNFTDTAILSDLKICKLDMLNLDFLEPTRLGHHLSGHSNKTWVDKGAFNKILEIIDVKSMIDVGCGPGGMVKYTKNLGIKSIGVDGDDSIIRDINEHFYVHDFTKGKFFTNLKFDLCWCVEFLEHVEEEFISNYFDTFKRCRFVFCTFAPKGKGGYHHVNTQSEEYWINAFERNNFVFKDNESKKIREASTINKNFIRDHGLLFKNNHFT